MLFWSVSSHRVFAFFFALHRFFSTTDAAAVGCQTGFHGLHGDVWHRGQRCFARKPLLDSFLPANLLIFRMWRLSLGTQSVGTAFLKAKLNPRSFALSSSTELHEDAWRPVQLEPHHAGKQKESVASRFMLQPLQPAALGLLVTHSQRATSTPCTSAFTLLVNRTTWRWVAEEPGLMYCRVWGADGRQGRGAGVSADKASGNYRKQVEKLKARQWLLWRLESTHFIL